MKDWFSALYQRLGTFSALAQCLAVFVDGTLDGQLYTSAEAGCLS